MNISNHGGRDFYVREPYEIRDGIPVFSKKDSYVENYEKIASYHVSQISDTQENPFMEKELWVSLEASTRALIQRYVPKGSRILDVGVGLGRLLEPLTEYDRYGVDISLDYLAVARQRGIEVALAKIEELPYKAGYFDAIVICDVLEHVFDFSFCCEKILACLRPGGVLFVRVPFKEDLDVYLRDDLPYEFIHLRSFDEASLRLHFQKIFSLQFLEAAPTTPYLQGTPRLKLRLLPEETRKKVAQMAADFPEVLPVASALEVSEEAFQAWIYELKDKSPILFKEISNDLILGIDINAAFIKPYSESDSHRALRAGTIQIQTTQGTPVHADFGHLGKDLLKFRVEVKEEIMKSEKAIADLALSIDTKVNNATIALQSLKDLVANELADTFLKKVVRKIRQYFNVQSR